MTRDQIKKMVLEVISQADYDLGKCYDPKTAEEPEYVQEELESLIDTAEKHIKKATKKATKSK
jgi:hypothetical protein